MKPQRQMLLFVSLTLLSVFLSLNANAEVLKHTYFSSRNFDLKVLTADSWEATFGKNLQIPRTDENVLALARSIYPPLGAKPLPTREKRWHCGDIKIRLLFAALQNPAITDKTREAVDRIIIQAAPPLPEEYTSGRFRILYTTSDPDVLHNVTLEEVRTVADSLNASWNAYAAKFKEPKHYHNGDGDDRIDVWLYYIDNETWGQTSNSWVHIEINTLITLEPCISKITAAHELFHRVQYAYGYEDNGDDWLVEGTATWAEKFRYPRERDYMKWMDEGLETPGNDLFARAYDAVHLFVYLTERSTLGSIKSTWANYQAKGAEQAFKDAVKAKTGLVFEKFLRDWHTANYVKDLRYAPAKYDYAEDEVRGINCEEEELGPLGSVPVSTYQYEVPSCITGSVNRYGANYVVIETPTNPRNLRIEITGGDDFSYRIIPVRGRSYLRLYNGNTNPFTFTRPSGTGTWSKVAVLVVGGASGGSYTIALGDKGCVKHGLKLMVGTPLINNQPVEYGETIWKAGAYGADLVRCDPPPYDVVRQDDPCYDCVLPPFQYNGCTVTGGGFLTVNAGTSVTYDASVALSGAASTSFNVTNNADGTEVVFSLTGSSQVDPTAPITCNTYTNWGSGFYSWINAYYIVVDITNTKDHSVNLHISWDYTVSRTFDGASSSDGGTQHQHRGWYGASYPCPSDPQFSPSDNLFSIYCGSLPGCPSAGSPSGSRTLQIDPGHVQHNLQLFSQCESWSSGQCVDCTPVPVVASGSYSGTVTLRLEDP